MDVQEDRLSNKARLRSVLSIMFPSIYIENHHRPPNSPCSVFNIKESPLAYNKMDYETSTQNDSDDEMNVLRKFVSMTDLDEGKNMNSQKFEPSTDPISRARVIQLCEQFDMSLIEHQAKSVGLCPIRRAIYDQCFDEIIRQVTVGCIEQGTLLFRIRNELRMSLNQFERIYESGVKFGINKAIDAEIKIQYMETKEKSREIFCQQEQDQELITRKQSEAYQSKVEQINEVESLARVKDYYQNELGKREQIITEQRNIIEALTRKYTQALKNPLD